jgi:DNA-binding transcriptional regulator YiaG
MERLKNVPVKERATASPLRKMAALQRTKGTSEELLPEYDATSFVGLRTMVYESAVRRTDKEGRNTIEVPNLRQLATSAAVARCLMPFRLKGAEIRTMRRLLGMTLIELAKSLDGKTAHETVSRWETDAQLMGGFAEKTLRLLVCERLKDEAPGVDYRASKISELKVNDPWKVDQDFEVPFIEFHFIKLRTDGELVNAWAA